MVRGLITSQPLDVIINGQTNFIQLNSNFCAFRNPESRLSDEDLHGHLLGMFSYILKKI
jgi:hypothetical protein